MKSSVSQEPKFGHSLPGRQLRHAGLRDGIVAIDRVFPRREIVRFFSRTTHPQAHVVSGLKGEKPPFVVFGRGPWTGTAVPVQLLPRFEAVGNQLDRVDRPRAPTAVGSRR